MRFEYTQKFWVCSIFWGLLQFLGMPKMFLSGLKRWLKSLGLLEIFKYAWKSLSTLKILSMLEPNFEKADGLGISYVIVVRPDPSFKNVNKLILTNFSFYVKTQQCSDFETVELDAIHWKHERRDFQRKLLIQEGENTKHLDGGRNQENKR